MHSPGYIQNLKDLEEVNKTLPNPPNPSNKKVGLFIPSSNGDIMTAMSVLWYKDHLWPNTDIICFCNHPTSDAFKYNDRIAEVRTYPWENLDFNTNGMKTSDNRINHTKKLEYELTRDLDDGYFPLPWMKPKRDGIPLANVSKRVFGVDPFEAWHPYLCFSQGERDMVKEFMQSLPSNRKNIMLETVCNSGQSAWRDEMTVKTIEIIQSHWGECNFIFGSKGANTHGHPSAEQFTVRQAALINDYCDLFIGISSGLSVATSHWGAKPTPKIQYCGNHICSTEPIANGPIILIYGETFAGPHNGWNHAEAENQYYKELTNFLNKNR